MSIDVIYMCRTMDLHMYAYVRCKALYCTTGMMGCLPFCVLAAA